ncbi:MAG: septum formation inhibitor Maf, partial [Bacteroidia bacterium]
MIADGLNDYDLILASASPRRKQLLEEAGFRFRTATIDYDEHWPGHLRGKEIAEFL